MRPLIFVVLLDPSVPLNYSDAIEFFVNNTNISKVDISTKMTYCQFYVSIFERLPKKFLSSNLWITVI